MLITCSVSSSQCQRLWNLDYIFIPYIFSGVKASLLTQGHTILFMLMVYSACTRTSKPHLLLLPVCQKYIWFGHFKIILHGSIPILFVVKGSECPEHFISYILFSCYYVLLLWNSARVSKPFRKTLSSFMRCSELMIT